MHYCTGMPGALCTGVPGASVHACPVPVYMRASVHACQCTCLHVCDSVCVGASVLCVHVHVCVCACTCVVHMAFYTTGLLAAQLGGLTGGSSRSEIWIPLHCIMNINSCSIHFGFRFILDFAVVLLFILSEERQ